MEAGRAVGIDACVERVRVISVLMIDVDGVVVTGRTAQGGPWHQQLRHDLGIAYADLRQRFFDRHWNDVTTGRQPLVPLLDAALAEIGSAVRPKTLIDYWHRNHAHLDQTVLAAIGGARLLGLRTILATNQSHERAHYLWSDLGLARHFDELLYSAALGSRKPNPEFYRAAMTHTGLAASAHLLIDDDAENVAAARTQGWNAELWSPGRRLDEIFARYNSINNSICGSTPRDPR